ncbi:hypothetical protein Tco_1399110 [Tanacetum coccineum]
MSVDGSKDVLQKRNCSMNFYIRLIAELNKFITRKKNLNGDVVETFKATVSEKLSALEEDMSTSSAYQMWNTLARTIKDAAKDSLSVASE